MSISPMAGRALNSWKNPGYGYHSHSSETDQPDITRGRARGQAHFKGMTHKRARVMDREEAQTQTQEWLDSLGQEFADEAEALVNHRWALSDGQSWVSASPIAPDLRHLWSITGPASGYSGDWHDELYLNLDDEDLDVDLDVRLGLLDDDEDCGLGMSTLVTLEEANTAGLRVTNKPSGYTYGRS